MGRRGVGGCRADGQDGGDGRWRGGPAARQIAFCLTVTPPIKEPATASATHKLLVAIQNADYQLQLLPLINFWLPYRTLITSQYGAKLCKTIISAAATTMIMIIQFNSIQKL